MKKSNPWISGLIFISVFAFLAWNIFELPTIFWGKTKMTTGKIIDTNIGYAVRGHRYIQNVKYAFSVNDKVYYDFSKVDKRFGKQQIGNRVLIEYSERNPEKKKVKGFYKDFKNSDGEKFHSSQKVGYSEIALTNGVFTFKKFGEQGKIVHEFRGEYKFEKDSLIVNSFANKDLRYFKLLTQIQTNN
ncbi:MAG: hypothetical protein P8X47_09960 [Ignavibacteriaceae bacterium]